MNKLQELYADRGSGKCSFTIFGFPCNQFGYQEPAENHELMNCIKYVRPGSGYVPFFPLAKKGDVNGMYEQPIYSFLKARCPSPFGLIANRSDITWQPLRNNDISWNFQKWLIRHDGQPYRRYTSRTTPQAVEKDVVQLLQECDDASQKQSQQATTGSSASQQQQQQPATFVQQQPQRPLAAQPGQTVATENSQTAQPVKTIAKENSPQIGGVAPQPQQYTGQQSPNQDAQRGGKKKKRSLFSGHF